jgi:thiamine biosynthesis lipoprotein
MRVALLFVILTAVLAPGIARAETLELRGATMGTTYHIKLVADPALVNADDLQSEIELILARIDRQMSTWRDDSELSRFNRAPAGEWFPVSEAVAAVVAESLDISEKTSGALDVTVGPLVRLWHFGPNADARVGREPSQFVPPSDQLIRQERRRVGYHQLEVRAKPPALQKKVDRLEIDLSSIASGYAIDLLARCLKERDITNYMVELGGEVRASGKREDGNPWRVGVERPSGGKREMYASVPLANAAMATAGDYRKFYEHNGRRYSHVIDPAGGRPIEHELASVTVVADTCMAADGWDTPLLILGDERGIEVADKNGVAALFLSTEDGKTKARASAEWQKRFGSE